MIRAGSKGINMNSCNRINPVVNKMKIKITIHNLSCPSFSLRSSREIASLRETCKICMPTGNQQCSKIRLNTLLFLLMLISETCKICMQTGDQKCSQIRLNTLLFLLMLILDIWIVAKSSFMILHDHAMTGEGSSKTFITIMNSSKNMYALSLLVAVYVQCFI